MSRFLIQCNNDDIQCGILELTPARARELLDLIKRFNGLKIKGTYALVLWDSSVDFHSWRLTLTDEQQDAIDHSEIYELKEDELPETALPEPERTNADLLFITDNSVYWQASAKHSSTEYETDLIPIKFLKKLARRKS